MATQLNNSGVLFPDSTTQISAGLTPGNWNTVSVGGSTTIAAGGRYYITAAGQAVTLPANPAVGSQVTISVGPSNITSVVVGNGQNIMGLAENMTINVANISVTLEYINSTQGWTIY